ncbi:hypothetical protein M422DRAFT_264840 [Sphaerobolus stellatus SS14]|uniref:Uncharacterized protein n=1 Tax=Sphaerobolus stellatus (strain SS14) TaxID=990650 RepID=A0A0C9V776_SPHS4|nr:hypothetical protein M422DRAFT_264840 [Sphaerobolus stellatus SS14]
MHEELVTEVLEMDETADLASTEGDSGEEELWDDVKTLKAGKPEPTEIAVFVPQGYSTEVKDLLYQNIGCENINNKPMLFQWKFDKQGAKAVNMGSETDWLAMRDEIVTEGKKKMPYKAEIVLDDNWLNDLCQRLSGKGPKDGPVSGKSRTKVLVNPDCGAIAAGLDSFSDEFGTEKVTDCEHEKHELVLQKLLGCENSPHASGSYCARTIQGAHVRMTARHVNSWAKAWAAGTISISLELSPNTPLFCYYYSVPSNAKIDSPKAELPKQNAAITPTPSSFNTG